MTPKVRAVLKWTLAAIFLALFVLYLLNIEWAYKPFYIMMSVVCLYNLFFAKKG